MYFNSYYGGFRTRSFADIFPDFQTFNSEYNTSGIPLNLLTGADYDFLCSLETIYFLLISAYANSHIKSSDENIFMLRVFRKIYEFAPTWQRNMYLQRKALNLSDDDIIKGTKAIYNHALNPDTIPSTATLTELPFIDNQSTNNFLKGKIEAFAETSTFLNTNFTEDFISKFSELFSDVLYPDTPLIYVTEDE